MTYSRAFPFYSKETASCRIRCHNKETHSCLQTLGIVTCRINRHTHTQLRARSKRSTAITDSEKFWVSSAYHKANTRANVLPVINTITPLGMWHTETIGRWLQRSIGLRLTFLRNSRPYEFFPVDMKWRHSARSSLYNAS